MVGQPWWEGLPESLCGFASRVASNFIMELVFPFPKWAFANIRPNLVPVGPFFFVRRILVFPIHQAETSSHLSPNLVTRVTDFLDLLMKK